MGLRWTVVLVIGAVLLLLRWRRAGMLSWSLAWWLAILAFLKLAFVTPIPSSVITLYLSIVTLAILTYVSSSPDRWEGFFRPIVRLVTEPRYKLLLVAVLLLVPAVAALNVYARMSVPIEAPAFDRTIHPAPPDTITVHDKEFSLITGDNPYRPLEHGDSEAFKKHLDNGRRVYFQNCFFCHGDAMAGDGMFVHALNPIPTNFTDQGVLPMLQESFLFWRIAKGGPGMPEEGGPWDSAMPAWEKFLTEEEIWDVIAFLYDYTAYQPRKPEVHH